MPNQKLETVRRLFSDGLKELDKAVETEEGRRQMLVGRLEMMQKRVEEHEKRYAKLASDGRQNEGNRRKYLKERLTQLGAEIRDVDARVLLYRLFPEICDGHRIQVTQMHGDGFYDCEEEYVCWNVGACVWEFVKEGMRNESGMMGAFNRSEFRDVGGIEGYENRILNHFKLTAEDVPLREVRTSSPKYLAALADANAAKK